MKDLRIVCEWHFIFIFYKRMFTEHIAELMNIFVCCKNKKIKVENQKEKNVIGG